MSKLILLRHGQSAWNEQNLFTGWVDIPLSAQGVREAEEAGKELRSMPIDVIFTSTLIRAHMTLTLALLHHDSKKIPRFIHPDDPQIDSWEQIFNKETEQQTIPVYQAWELNERMYGQLQGFNKETMSQKYGKQQVHEWRRSFDALPPGGESLSMTMERTIPYFQSKIQPHLDRKENVLICAHGNSLRAIIMYWEKLNSEEIIHRELATGQPLVYEAAHPVS